MDSWTPGGAAPVLDAQGAPHTTRFLLEEAEEDGT